MNDARDEPAQTVFLTVEVVLALHRRQLERYGGSPGLRDRGLLESAVTQPQTSFGGAYARRDLREGCGVPFDGGYPGSTTGQDPDPRRGRLRGSAAGGYGSTPATR